MTNSMYVINHVTVINGLVSENSCCCKFYEEAINIFVIKETIIASDAIAEKGEVVETNTVNKWLFNNRTEFSKSEDGSHILSNIFYYDKGGNAITHRLTCNFFLTEEEEHETPTLNSNTMILNDIDNIFE